MFAEPCVLRWSILLLIYNGTISYKQQTTLLIQTRKKYLQRYNLEFNSIHPYVSCDDNLILGYFSILMVCFLVLHKNRVMSLKNSKVKKV